MEHQKVTIGSKITSKKKIDAVVAHFKYDYNSNN